MNTKIIKHIESLRNDFLTTAIQSAIEAKEIIQFAHQSRKQKSFTINFKQTNDLVTEIDRQSELKIREILQSKFPEIPVLGEEFSNESIQDALKSEFLWIVDPLDGTTNFAHGFPQFSVSIALIHFGLPIVGVVYEVVRNDCFYAVKGNGAWLNGEKLETSQNPLHKSLIATGFPYYEFSHIDKYMSVFKEVMTSTHGIRRAGSAASDLAYTSAGWFDGYWEFNLKPWDIAAGLLLVQEAGGIVTDFEGGNSMLISGNVVAGGYVHSELLEIVQKYYK